MRNGDPNFDKLLLSAKLVEPNTIIQDKKRLFYTVCIVVRLVLYSLILLLAINKAWYLPYIILLVALLSAINLTIAIYSGNNNQWWSKWFQLAIATVLIIASLLTISNVNTNYYIFPIILYFSLIGGVVQSLANGD